MPRKLNPEVAARYARIDEMLQQGVKLKDALEREGVPKNTWDSRMQKLREREEERKSWADIGKLKEMK